MRKKKKVKTPSLEEQFKKEVSSVRDKAFIFVNPRPYINEDEIIDMLERKGFEKTTKIWAGKWADLGKRDKLKGFLKTLNDFKNREREVIVIIKGSVDRCAKEFETEWVDLKSINYYNLLEGAARMIKEW